MDYWLCGFGYEGKLLSGQYNFSLIEMGLLLLSLMIVPAGP
jgi:hypothetical protein